MSNPTQIFPTIQSPSTTDNRRWRPQPFEDHDLDFAIKTAFDSVYGLEHRSTQSPDSLHGGSVAAGALSVTGSAKAVVTGLKTLSNIVVSIDNGAIATNLWVTATPSSVVAGAFDVYCWKPTSNVDNTPIAATSAVNVRWHAWGTT